MCGIIGIASNKFVTSNIINSLKKLEYRGYDSAGIATIINGDIDEKKCTGRVDNLEKMLFKSPSNGSLGIGHVRWATHGIPNQVNAHPHSSEEVSVVHNGIIENFEELFSYFSLDSKNVISETDSEVIAEIFNKLLRLPEKTLVYPAHDYNGKKCSTIRDEKNNNPRLQVSSAEEYAEIMNNLNLELPEMIDIAVPANKKGLTLNQIK